MRTLMGRLLVLAVLVTVPVTLRAGNPDALWNIVHDQSVPSELGGSGPAPCRLVDLKHGYAILKDIRGATQFLLIPTAKVTGIEDPQILAPGAPNYWEAAWRARIFMAERAGRPVPREDVGLAINSVHGRSQNQLHIHIDCLNASAKQALAQAAGQIGEVWSPLAQPVSGHSYLAMKVEAPDLSNINLFRLVADGIPSAAADMGDQTIVVAGAVLADGRPGYYILDDHADPAQGDRGSGEELLDHECRALR
jgi:CDP-diacylglycerol pyrophosphatase